jgi:hypothetical protein
MGQRLSRWIQEKRVGWLATLSSPWGPRTSAPNPAILSKIFALSIQSTTWHTHMGNRDQQFSNLLPAQNGYVRDEASS